MLVRRAAGDCWRSTWCCLRRAFRPLDELAETMRRHDPLSPGERVAVDGGPDVAALAQTFNEMLDRLESERRESARRALLRAGGRAPADRARAARRGRPDAHRRDAAGRGPRRRDPRRAARAARRAARDRPRTAPRTCAASRAGCGPRRSRISGCRARWPRWRPRSASRRTSGSTGVWSRALPLSEEQELVDLPRRAGGADQRRPPRRRDAASSCASSAPTTHDRADRARRRSRTAAGRAAVVARHPRHARARDADRRRSSRSTAPPGGGTEVKLSIPIDPRTP